MPIHEILEAAMLVSFGISWPLNALKSYRARTAKGKSLAFLVLIFSGYLCGIASKLISGSWSVFLMAFYLFNAAMVGIDLVLYFRNRRLDHARGEA